MLVFFLIIGGLIYLATMYIKQKYGTLDTFVEEAKKQLSGNEEKEPDVFEDPNFPPEPSNLVAPSPEDPDVEAQEEVPEPTQEQLSKWKELEEMCKPGGLRSIYTGFKVDEETGEFVPEYENIDCCYEQPWENEGECIDGQQKQVRGILNEDLCDVETDKEKMVDCCSYGQWENDGGCVDGVQKQKRQIFNEEMCTDTTSTREIDCCSYGEWVPEGGCVEGVQNYTRTIINSKLCEDTSLKKTEPCCFPLEWTNEGECKATGMQKQVRGHINRELCTGDKYEDVQELACCYRGPWETVRECDYKEGKIQQKRINVNDEICRAEGDPATTRTLDCCKISEWQNDGDCDEVNGIQKQIRTLEMAETCPPNIETSQEVECCKRGPWNTDPAWNGGVCNFDGKIRVLREIELFDTCRNTDEDDPENALTEIRDCCYKSEWEKDGFCGDYEYAKQKYTRTIKNPEMCGDDGDAFGLQTERMEDCCALTPWEIDKSRGDAGQNYCRADGTRFEKRELVNRSMCRGDSEYLIYEDRVRRVPCCYKADWKDDQGCGFYQNGKQKQTRVVSNPDLCVADSTDDMSMERYNDCCDIGEWTYAGDNLDGKLGRVKEVRDVYNCPSNVSNTQYEREVCYMSEWIDRKCNDGKREQQRTVINCESDVSSTQTITETRQQNSTMGHCHNITGVTDITFTGLDDTENAYGYVYTLTKDSRGGPPIKKSVVFYYSDGTLQKKSGEGSNWVEIGGPDSILELDAPCDIYKVWVRIGTQYNDANFRIKFWDKSDGKDFEIRSLHQYAGKGRKSAWSDYRQWNYVSATTTRPMTNGF